jgi:uncharacterized membrane protein (Fun14 family)
MTIESSLGQFAPGLVGGGAFGFVVGWGFKKLFKIILTVVGVISALVFSVIYWLEYKGVLKVSIDFAKFYALVNGVTTSALNHASAVTSFVLQLNVGFVGFAAGALLGWRIA